MKELEKATKSIFMQCLNDPGIVQAIIGKINCIEQQDVQLEQEDKNNINGSVDINDILNKIDLIIKQQQSLEEYIKSSNSNEMVKKLEYEKKQYINKIQSLKEKLEIETKKNQDFIEKNASQSKKIEDLSAEKKDIEKSIEIIKDQYSSCEEFIEIVDCVNSLNEDDIEYVRKLCGCMNIFSITSLGRDENKIEQLWLYLRNIAVKNEDEKEISLLNKYFEFCIKVYNSSKEDDEKLHILDVEIGSEFDIMKSVRTSDSRQIGSVKYILVKGFCDGDNVKYKSIVKVE